MNINNFDVLDLLGIIIAVSFVPLLILYLIIKNAVKNGILKAYEKINLDNLL